MSPLHSPRCRRNVFSSGCAVTSTQPATTVTGIHATSSIPGAFVSGARSWDSPSSTPTRATTPITAQ